MGIKTLRLYDLPNILVYSEDLKVDKYPRNETPLFFIHSVIYLRIYEKIK